MRYILKRGVKLTKYRCPLCGQEELLSDDETSKCSNCGEDMSALSVAEVFKVEEHPDPKTEPGAVTEITPEEKPKKKPGRPPKAKPEKACCANCSKAMYAIQGFTCKETCESVKADNWCIKHYPGDPVGSAR